MAATLLQSGISNKPEVSKTNIVDILSKYYGLKVKLITQLNGYDDLNFHIITEENHENENIGEVSKNGYVLKIINGVDSTKPEFFEAQNQLLAHLGAQEICCPRSVPTKNKTLFFSTQLSSGNHVIRLLDFIPGKILDQVSPKCDFYYDCGKYVARLDLALKNFYHPVYDTHKSLWHLECFIEMSSRFLFAITDSCKRQLVENVINEFRKTVLPLVNQLEKGMIHGDFNEQNILVEEIENEFKVKGILDFGDSHKSCYVYELAITMTYMMLQAKSMNVGKYVIEGYNLVRKIPNKEYSILKVCIAARLCQSLVLGAYSIQMDPENKYIIVNSKPGWIMLEELWKTPKDQLFLKWNVLSE